jgi:hypothetical protein
MKSIINGETEDKIFEIKTFINNLQEVSDEKFEKLWKIVEKNISEEFSHISKETIKDYLFDYVFNEKDPLLFEEYLGRYSRILD